MNKNIKQTKKILKTKPKRKQKKNRNKIDDEFVHNKTNIAESHKTRRAVVKINLQPFFKVHDTLVELT